MVDDKDTNQIKERAKTVEGLLGNPVLLDSSDEVSKTRLRLLIVAAFSFAVGIFNLRIDDNASLLGLKVIGLTDEVIRSSLFAIICYTLVHFIWSMWDAFVEWRLRLTGINEAIVQGGLATLLEYLVASPNTLRRHIKVRREISKSTSIGTPWPINSSMA